MAAYRISRRHFVESSALTLAGAACPGFALGATALLPKPLDEFSYGDVSLSSELHERQLQHTISVLMSLSDDSLLKPLRKMAGQPAPGDELGGWYLYNPDYEYRRDGDNGFAPGSTFGQWVSALARAYAITKSAELRDRVLRLNRLYARTVSPGFYTKNRFPAYCYDKIVCGLIDSHRFVGDSDAYAILDHTTDTALPHLPPKAVEHGVSWRPGTDESYTWDESYTISENLFLAYRRGAGERYRELGTRYLDDAYYDPLAQDVSDLNGRHAYSHVNSLCSAMRAYLTLGNEKYLRAAKNGFDFVAAQSYATGGWGPDETLRAPDSPDLAVSLTNTHNSFETPCGSYAHFKLTRYLLRVTADPRYGDSMERVMYNTVLGAKPLQPDGRAFYYSDYNFDGRKFYHAGRWPCCSGTLPQVAADYRINTYFRDARGLYANLYIPSTLTFVQGNAKLSLLQHHSYPFDSLVNFVVTTSQPATFALRLRIPEWTANPSVSVNGRRLREPVIPGSFYTVEREWKSGDQIDLDLPLKLRLQALDCQHEDLVALLSGPLVLFPTGTNRDAAQEALPTAKRVGPMQWQVDSASGPVLLLPFVAIEDQPYSTYSKTRWFRAG